MNCNRHLTKAAFYGFTVTKDGSDGSPTGSLIFRSWARGLGFVRVASGVTVRIQGFLVAKAASCQSEEPWRWIWTLKAVDRGGWR
jgi:hypothetical protein